MSDADWTAEIPYDDFSEGTAEFLIRGTGDPEDSAFRVRVEVRPKPPEHVMAMESVLVGLKFSRIYDVVGVGNDFERRPLYEVDGVLWKRAT